MLITQNNNIFSTTFELLSLHGSLLHELHKHRYFTRWCSYMLYVWWGLANLPLSLMVEEFWKSVNIWRSYDTVTVTHGTVVAPRRSVYWFDVYTSQLGLQQYNANIWIFMAVVSGASVAATIVRLVSWFSGCRPCVRQINRGHGCLSVFFQPAGARRLT